ncbi:MAG: pyridoxamine 5'-phosphate oxidase family protein [Methylotenera sp.]|nr:pyridoxamine 5'-phosphate oxidase family protein [Oligoflexia bacterium]
MTHEQSQSVQKLGTMIQGIQIAMMTTEESDGVLRSRPMATQNSEFDGTLWFFTREHSPKVEEVQKHHMINLSYAEPSDNRYISITGRAELVKDENKARELWNPLLKAWFPKGLSDPELALLKVTVDHAEYWETTSSTMVQVVGFLKAVTTGKKADHVGDHGKLDLAG